MKKLFLNQKSALTNEAVQKFIGDVKIHRNKLNILPSFIYLKDYIDAGFITGSQDIAYKNTINQSGEVTSDQLKSIGIKFVMIGHSERRENQKETKNILRAKFDQAISNNFDIVYCIGESLVDYKLKETYKKIISQLNDIFENNDLSKIQNKIYIAYEPVWAIGSGFTPTNAEIECVAKSIKNYFTEKEINIEILYGGSVNANNILELNNIDSIDGFLVGGASNSSEKTIPMIENLMNSTK